MKLNFWQWLGLILLAIGVALWSYERRKVGTAPTTAPAPTTQSP